MANLSDRDELVERARGGDRGALTALFSLDEARILRMVQLRLDPSLRSRLDAADIVQETWIEAEARFDGWRALPALPFHVWLRLVSAETLVNVHRRHLATHKRDALREARADARLSISTEAFAEAFVTSQTTPTRAVRRDEVRARVVQALSELDESDREIIALRHFEGLSNEEAAKELAIEPAAASKRFVRALARLRPALKALASDPGAGR